MIQNMVLSQIYFMWWYHSGDDFRPVTGDRSLILYMRKVIIFICILMCISGLAGCNKDAKEWLCELED